MNNNAKNKTKQIVGIGVMTAIIAVLSQITIPLPTHVPVTLQTFAVALAGYFLGWKGGAVSALVYGLLGAIGVPVFAGWSGGFFRYRRVYRWIHLRIYRYGSSLWSWRKVLL